MRTLCPNYDREDALETVLEVPIPEEMFPSTTKSWKNMKTWMRSNNEKSPFFNQAQLFGGGGSGGGGDERNAEIQLLLGVAGAPLIPLPLKSNVPTQAIKIKDHPIEASMAKYIVKQYLAAVGGEKVIDSITSMYAMGQVKMVASDFKNGENAMNGGINKGGGGGAKVKSLKHSNHVGGNAACGGEMGGFVLWQKRPELWCLELVVSGCKISAGSDGKVAWRQTPWHNSHASRGPPRPLRRSLQGLDPRATANLFINSTCIGEKAVAGEDCFVLKLEAQPLSLKARSSSNVEIIRHTVWGYFNQKTGLLIQLEDSHLLRIKSSSDDGIFWETTMESLIQDYRIVDGVNIAHAGKTSVSLFRFGESSERHSRTRMEETWTIEEVDFNIKGLSMVCFLPPSDMKVEADFVEEEEDQQCNVVTVKSNAHFPFKIRAPGSRVSGSRVAAIDDDDEDCHDDDDYDE